MGISAISNVVIGENCDVPILMKASKNKRLRFYRDIAIVIHFRRMKRRFIIIGRFYECNGSRKMENDYDHNHRYNSFAGVGPKRRVPARTGHTILMPIFNPSDPIRHESGSKLTR